MYIVHTFFASKPTVTCSICRLSQGYHYLAVHTHTHLPDYFSPSPLVSSHSSPVSTNLSMKTMSVAVSWSDALSEWIKTVCRVDQPSQTLLDTRPANTACDRRLASKECVYNVHLHLLCGSYTKQTKKWKSNQKERDGFQWEEWESTIKHGCLWNASTWCKQLQVNLKPHKFSTMETTMNMNN